jgi:signal transduction histidine kinase
MTAKLKTKFLLPILLLQFVALAALGYIGYRFSANILRENAEKQFKSTIDAVYDAIEGTLNNRITKIELLLKNPVFIKYNAGAHYKSDVDIEVFNFQKGNGLVLGEPEVKGLVNYPIGLLPGEGGKKIISAGEFPSEEYVGLDGMAKQHVYLGGSNDANFETGDKFKLTRKNTPWFKTAMSGQLYLGKPEDTKLFLREYDPVSISQQEKIITEKLLTIAMPHKIGERIAGVFMVTTTPQFIYEALPKGDSKYLLLITDGQGNTIAKAGNESIDPEITKTSETKMRHKKQGVIFDGGDLLVMYRSSPVSGWNVEIFGRETDIYGAIYLLRNNIFIVMVSSISVMGLIIFLIVKKLLKPIYNLTSASDRIANGELGVVIAKENDDEIGSLTESFNKMSVSTKQMHDRISRINFVRQQLLQIISHELRTPLNAIVGFYDLINDGIAKPGNDDFDDCFKGLGSSIDKYKVLVERLTKTSTVMTGEMSEEGPGAETCRLYDTVAIAVNEARKHRPCIETNIADPFFEDIEIACPMDALKLVINEALSNTIKYSEEEKKIRVTVSASSSHVSIEIHDDGEGIPEEYIEEVTMPFFEVKDSMLHFTSRYKPGGGGLGLGLSIISGVVKRYQGSLEIKSKSGDGTSLFIRLPRSSPTV